MPQLRILILSDERPGHYNISEGIATALGRRFSTTVARMTARRGPWSGLALALLVNGGLSPKLVLSQVYGIDAARIPLADLVVSAGAETLAANAALARYWRVPNVFYGSLRHFAARHYALALTSYAEHVRQRNQAMVLKPSPIDADTLPQPRRQFQTVGLLVGGDGGRVVYRDKDWTQLVDFLPAARDALGVSWAVSNSRRTPDDVSDRLARMVAGTDPVISTFIDVRDQATGNLRNVFEVADALLVTTDSSTMVSEAVQLRRPVASLAPDRCWLPAAETRYRRYMVEQGWLAPMALRDITPEGLAQKLLQLRPIKTNPLDTLGDLIVEKVPALAAFANGR